MCYCLSLLTLDSAHTVGNVYNVAPYMDFHPGGIEQLRRATGTVGTQLFNEVWSESAMDLESSIADASMDQLQVDAQIMFRRPVCGRLFGLCVARHFSAPNHSIAVPPPKPEPK